MVSSLNVQLLIWLTCTDFWYRIVMLFLTIQTLIDIRKRGCQVCIASNADTQNNANVQVDLVTSHWNDARLCDVSVHMCIHAGVMLDGCWQTITWCVNCYIYSSSDIGSEILQFVYLTPMHIQRWVSMLKWHIHTWNVHTISPDNWTCMINIYVAIHSFQESQNNEVIWCI